jgi:hypothetical protein
MSQPSYRRESTALLIVDPCNGLLSGCEKTWPRVKAIAEEVGGPAQAVTIAPTAGARPIRGRARTGCLRGV